MVTESATTGSGSGSGVGGEKKEWLRLVVGVVVAGVLGYLTSWYFARDQMDEMKRQTAIMKRQLDTETANAEAYKTQSNDYRRALEAAPSKYHRELGQLIERAPTEGQDALNRVSVTARSIVATRNDLRSSLEAIGSRLDSQIDELAAELAKPKPDGKKLLDTLMVLKQKWPAKAAELDLVVRKMLVELGLEKAK